MTVEGRPVESPLRLFQRFLRFGLLAWGGPVAQIAMIRHELVEEEKWITGERFNRVLAVYQVLPGPEATELCVYFGMLAGGRFGGLLAGLGFMLPGFVAILALSLFYVTVGLTSPFFAAVFAGFQPAVAALIARAVHRIGARALTDRWLWSIAILVAIAELMGANFFFSLTLAGLMYFLIKRGWTWAAVGAGALLLALSLFEWLLLGLPGPSAAGAPGFIIVTRPSLPALFLSGLRGGLLTFGGAYTSIPFLRNDAVVVGGWLTDRQFLDGLALSGVLPAPLIIFATFIGYLGGGLPGALVITLGIFLPAFAFTLVGHNYVERLVENQAAHAFLDGVTAGVVGLITATTLELGRTAITSFTAFLIFSVALIVLYRWKDKAAVAVVMLGAGVLGLLLFLNLAAQ
ncbi:MAG: chromate efflux transporter [Chloroflexi bacterium]|nr:chromate efflux transporter [Chloroflexota bacterium]